MNCIAIFAALLTVCNAGLLPSPYYQRYAVPSVLTHSRVAIPASIPTTVSEVVTRAQTVPEHRFSSSEWIQPTTHITPAVRQYTVRQDIPVAVRSVSYEPTVEYSHGLVSYAVPSIHYPSAHPIYEQTILKR